MAFLDALRFERLGGDRDPALRSVYGGFRTRTPKALTVAQWRVTINPSVARGLAPSAVPPLCVTSQPEDHRTLERPLRAQVACVVSLLARALRRRCTVIGARSLRTSLLPLKR